MISNKLRNKHVHASNVNIINRSIVKLAHWNMGNKCCENKKTEIEALILDKSPDLLYISEANLMDTLQDFERQRDGYTLHLPSTMQKHRYARLVLLVKDGVDVIIHNDLMHEYIAVMWVSVKNGRRKLMKIGGINCKHKLLWKPKPNPTSLDSAQLEGWNQFLAGWKRAAKDNMCVMLEDTNLDYIKWETPDQSHEK